MKIIHTGDLHFDNPPQLLAEVVKCSEYLIKTAEMEQPDMIIVAGDTFHERVDLGSPASLAAMEFIKKCGDIAPTLIIRGTSTHDAPGSTDALGKLKAKNPIFSTDRLCQVALTAEGFIMLDEIGDKPVNALISCLPSVTKANVVNGNNLSAESTKHETIDLLRDVLCGWGSVNKEIQAPTILVGHFTVTGSITPTGQVMVGRELELTAGDLRLAKADLVCLGHIHKMQSWGEIFYCGSITRLNHGEANDEKGYFIHEFIGKSLSSRFIETPARVMRTRKTATIPTEEDMADVEAGEYVRLIFEVSDDDIAKIDEQAIINAALAKGTAEVKIEKIIISKSTTRAEGISKLKNVEEKLKRWAELTGVTLNDDILAKLAELETIDNPKEYFMEAAA